ncbi:MAG: hypothetical protein ACM3UT_01485 [Chloroflexota bacterium]
MRTFILHIVILILVPFTLKGQDVYSDTEAELEKLFSRLASTSADSDRIRVNDSIRSAISAYASTEQVFAHTFSTLRYLGQVTSTDTLLKIISWNLNLENYKGKYFSYFIRKGNDAGQNRVINLEADYNVNKIDTDTTLTASQWYGALYYAVRPVLSEGSRRWIVLGLDYGNPAVTRKIIDVLSFDDNDALLFGRKWFENPSGVRYRAVFEYASSGMMTLRFNSDSSIVFDHLVQIPSLTSNNKVYYGPDYSYDAYVFENGTWKFKLNVDARNLE